MNPIYIEYSSHDKENAFKMNNPWTKYGKETVVLCKVSQGITLANVIATGYIIKWFEEALGIRK